MRLGPAFAIVVAALCLLAACQSQTQSQARPQTTTQSPVSPTVDPGNVAFGFTDATGSKLLMLDEDNIPAEPARARIMTTALCSDGREFPIRYIHLQEASAGDNGRKSEVNFAHSGGHLFEVSQGPAEHGDTCMLVPGGYLQAFPVSRNDFPRAERDRRRDLYRKRATDVALKTQRIDLQPFHAITDFAKQNVNRIERDKGRPAKLYWLLHRHGNAQEVATVEFDAVGGSLLASLVLVDATRAFYFDMPASLNDREKGGCWRVDDGCRFQPDGMDAAVFGAPGRQLVLYTAWGAEGQAIVLYEAKDGRLVELKNTYRYHAPL